MMRPMIHDGFSADKLRTPTTGLLKSSSLILQHSGSFLHEETRSVWDASIITYVQTVETDRTVVLKSPLKSLVPVVSGLFIGGS